MKKIELYNDFELKNKLTESDEHGFILDLGEGEVGEVKEFEYYIYNPDEKVFKTDLKFEVNHPEVKIEFAPTSLDPKQKAKLKIIWSPALEIEDALVTGMKIVGNNKWKKPNLVG